MIQSLSEPISVQFVFDHKLKQTKPQKILWRNKSYSINKVGLHHTYYEGKNLQHIFSVCTDQLFFRLRLDSLTLFWTLEEISDGLPE